MSENWAIVVIMLSVAVAMLTRVHLLRKTRENLVRDFLADPERRARQWDAPAIELMGNGNDVVSTTRRGCITIQQMRAPWDDPDFIADPERKAKQG